MKARKKPIDVNVWKLDHNDYRIPYWVMGASGDGSLYYEDKRWHVATLEGVMVAFDGDYLIQGAHGEIYPCKKDVFEDTYEVLA